MAILMNTDFMIAAKKQLSKDTEELAASLQYSGIPTGGGGYAC